MPTIERSSLGHAMAESPPAPPQLVFKATTSSVCKPVEVADFFAMVNNIVDLWYGPERRPLKDSSFKDLPKENDDRTRHPRTAD